MKEPWQSRAGSCRERESGLPRRFAPRNDSLENSPDSNRNRAVRLLKNCPTKGFGGRKSVKGNRQGSLSRSITPPQRAKLQNNLPYSYFAILKAACRKSP